MSTVYDPDYPRRQREAVFARRRLTVLVVGCGLFLALFTLVVTGPSDSQIEGGQSVEATR